MKKQVLIIGGGQLARHLIYYFNGLKQPFIQWQRSDGLPQLTPLVSQSEIILLAVSDQSIETFYDNHLKKLLSPNTSAFHFSGALTLPLIPSVHPLMTFSALKPFKFLDYQKIPLILEKNRPSGTYSFWKSLANPHYEINKDDKALYHAYCVLISNLPQILTAHVKQQVQKNLNIDPSCFNPILEKTFSQLISSNRDKISGPIGRKDYITLEKNLMALNASPKLQKILLNFCELENISFHHDIKETPYENHT